MRAVGYDRYGPPEVLRVEHVPRPTPKRGQVLVEVVADVGQPHRLGGPARVTGLRPHRRAAPAAPPGARLGHRGRVDAVGAGRDPLRRGDEVYGDNLALKGGFAEYAVAPESALAPKPAALTFVEASTIPQAGAIAPAGNRRRRARDAGC